MVDNPNLSLLLRTMTIPVYPFDVALERGWWSAEVNVFTVKNNLIELGPNSHDTAIATKPDYKRQ
jgi:glycosyl transferase family 25